jgi:Insertion element 4 transposase N-terminal
MAWGWESARGRLLSRLGLGILSHVVTPGLVDEAVGDGLAWEMRVRALPSLVGAYFVLGLCLFSGRPYAGVLRQLAAGLEDALETAGWKVPAATALTGVRRRLGERPMESLFRKLAGACSPGRAPWSHLGGLLVAAWDGTCLTVADSKENAAAFGRPGAGRRKKGGDEPAADRASVYPQARLVALVACGTRALLGAAFGPVRGKGTGERDLAFSLLGSLHAGMLLLADRGFYSWKLWSAAAGTGAGLLWRVGDTGNCLLLPVQGVLPDGSWLSRVWERPARQGRRLRKDRGASLPVRVIEFAITIAGDDGNARTERYRLVTTLLDHRAFPAPALAACYARRWSAEIGHRWYPPSWFAFSWLRSFGAVGVLTGRVPAGAGVVSGRACPALA